MGHMSHPIHLPRSTLVIDADLLFTGEPKIGVDLGELAAGGVVDLNQGDFCFQ
jgi:hypothetical protein